MVDLSSYFLEKITEKSFPGLPATKLNISREKKTKNLYILFKYISGVTDVILSNIQQTASHSTNNMQKRV